MHYPRYIEDKIRAALADTPVVLIHGPRQSGKTTLAKSIAKPHYRYISFDDDTELKAAQFDPKGYIEDLPEYCIIDEVQRVPELFTSIKLAVDRHRVPGKFLLTGSANILSLPELSDSLAGRIEVIHLFPLAQTEIQHSQCPFLTEAYSGSIKRHFDTRLGHQLPAIIASGGFPEPLSRNTEERKSAPRSSSGHLYSL